MDIISTASLCISVCLICKLLDKNFNEIKILIVICTICIIFTKITSDIIQIENLIKELFEKGDMDQKYLIIILKSLGICYITQISSDCCKDCGETCLAAQAEIVGKISMTVISLPLLRAIIEIVETLIE